MKEARKLAAKLIQPLEYLAAALRGVGKSCYEGTKMLDEALIKLKAFVAG